MKTLIKEENDIIVMYLEGRLDTAAAVQTEADMRPLYDCTDRDIMLDCTHLEYISSSGLRLFLGLLKSAKSKGGHVFIRGLNSDLQSVFNMTGFSSIFEFK